MKNVSICLFVIGGLLLLCAGCDETTQTSVSDIVSPSPDTGPPDVAGTDTYQEDVQETDTADPGDTVILNDTHTDATDDIGTTDATPDSAEEDTINEDVQGEDLVIGPTLCDPPLIITPSSAQVLPYQLIPFIPSGGTGAYQFIHLNNGDEDEQSYPIVNPFTGAYIAGHVTGTTDIVALRDLECEGEALAEIHVLNPMIIAPSSAVVVPGTTMQFEATEGSGDFEFILSPTVTGSTLTLDGLYMAGPSEGIDSIDVFDLQTGAIVTASVEISADTQLTAVPAHLFVAEGSQAIPVFDGGSGHVLLEIQDEEIVTYEDGVLVPGVSGQTKITVTDVFTNQTTNLTVDTVASVQTEIQRAGDLTSWTYFTSAGDINQDGYPDAVLGHLEADIGAWNGGAIFIYAGDENGLAAEPARIIGSETRNDQFGRDFELADLNNDGKLDLIVGASHADVTLSNNGAIYVYMGSEGAFFEENPSYVLIGPGNSDYLGFSVAVCDFNGDGRLDIVGGASYLEHSDPDIAVTNQGGFLLWLGYPDGFLPDADMETYAWIPDEAGGWTAQESMFGGHWSATGDLNNDGKCDLALTAQSYTPSSGGNTSGAVLIYTGEAGDGVSLGGLSALPSRVIVADNNSQFGRTLAIGDLNHDSVDDLIVGHPYFDGPSPTNPTTVLTDSGAVRVYLGSENWSTTPASTLESYETNDWFEVGDGGSNRLGWGVRVRQADEIEGAELLVGSFADEIAAGENGNGSIQLFGLPAEPKNDAFQLELRSTAQGLNNYDYFGTALDTIGDVDNDGLMDWIGFSLRNDIHGMDVGCPYYVRNYFDENGLPSFELLPLNLPGTPAGHRLGWSVAGIGDINDDGYDDVATGTPLLDYVTGLDETGGQTLGYIDGGEVTVHLGGPNGPSLEPDHIIRQFMGHSGETGSISGNDDELGIAINAAGDFDGDGIDDLVAVARISERMATPNTTYFQTKGVCGGATASVGGVFVFRGNKDALPDTNPMLIYWPEITGSIYEVAGGMDINGDGKDDVIFSSYNWDENGSNSGGFYVLYGRDADAGGKPIIVCPGVTPEENTYEFFAGSTANMEMGRTLSKMGYLNGDSCEDFIVGVGRDAYTYGASTMANEGSVRIVYGWGGSDCPSNPTQTVLTAQLASDRFGFAVDGGHDLDGDGIPDLVVGAYNYGNSSGTVGAATFIPGHYLQTLPAEPLLSEKPGETPLASIPDNISGVFRIEGKTAGGQFGWSIAAVPNVFPDGTGLMAVGHPKGELGGVPLSGGVEFYRVYPSDSQKGVEPIPHAIFTGEVFRPEGRVGDDVAYGGMTGNGPSLMVGGYWGNGTGLDAGSAYILDLFQDPAGDDPANNP